MGGRRHRTWRPCLPARTAQSLSRLSTGNEPKQRLRRCPAPKQDISIHLQPLGPSPPTPLEWMFVWNRASTLLLSLIYTVLPALSSQFSISFILNLFSSCLPLSSRTCFSASLLGFASRGERFYLGGRQSRLFP